MKNIALFMFVLALQAIVIAFVLGHRLGQSSGIRIGLEINQDFEKGAK